MMMRRLPHLLFALHVLVTVLALAGPGATWAGSRVQPLVLGMPFSLAWSAAWSAAMFLAMALYYRATDGGRE